jgi:subfamily B ATP-binding cassette protein MsbA
MKTTIKRFVPYFKNYKPQFIFLLIGLILTALGTVGSAHIIKPILDDIFIDKNEIMLYIVPFMLIGIYAIKGVGRYIQGYFTNYIGQDIIKDLRNNLLKNILHLDFDYFNKTSSGDLISRISNDIMRVQFVAANMIPDFILQSITIVGLISYAIYLSPILAFFALVVIPVTFYPLSILAKKMKKISRKAQEKNADVMIRLTESFNNIEVIKANASEDFEVNRFKKENQHFFDITMKGVKTNELISPMMEIFGAFGIALVIMLGGKEVIQGNMSVGSFFSFLTAIGMTFDPIKRLSSLYNKMQDAIAASERIFSLMDQKPLILSGNIILNKQIEYIKFNNVELFYDKKQALFNINLKIKKGQTYALVGQSGGGKSSFINLLTRFYDTHKGLIEFNNENIKNYTLKSLRSQIAIVSQRIYIFEDTLCANVAYGQIIDKKRVLQVLKDADLEELVLTLKNGIDTKLQENGTNLSGGQKQRLAIARAMYKNTSVLILDEATSALDNATEKRIKIILKQYTKDKITFIIAHRLSTIELADTILVFDKGHIVDRGNHIDLLKYSKIYKNLHSH